MRRKPSVRYLLGRGSANDSERSDAFKPWVKVLLVTVLVTIAAMAAMVLALSSGPSPRGAEPTAGQLALFIVLEAIQSLAIGAGVSFCSGCPRFARSPRT
jgi:hypothetical protein